MLANGPSLQEYELAQSASVQSEIPDVYGLFLGAPHMWGTIVLGTQSETMFSTTHIVNIAYSSIGTSRS